MSRRRFWRVAGALGAASTLAGSALAQETVTIAVPPFLSFDVVTVSAPTSAVQNPTRVGFENAALLPGRAVRISVRAEGDLTRGGSSIPASRVSWTTANVSNGVAANGTLTTTGYTVLFEGQVGAAAGGVDVSWTLDAPGASVRAGTHQLTLRWKVESVTP